MHSLIRWLETVGKPTTLAHLGSPHLGHGYNLVPTSVSWESHGEDQGPRDASPTRRKQHGKGQS